jgi:2-amino-4-hydroxy-6-hydroxymethyldihydropteridine diphosphokinase
MNEVFVGIGSNVDPVENTRKALRALREHFGGVTQSTIFESEAVGFDGANFLNLVVRFVSDLSLADIITVLREIEDQCGRTRNSLNGDGKEFSDRTLDLDVLLYGDRVGSVQGVELPRSEITEHAHVLRPLAELAGEKIDPASGRSYASLVLGLEGSGQKLRPVEL